MRPSSVSVSSPGCHPSLLHPSLAAASSRGPLSFSGLPVDKNLSGSEQWVVSWLSVYRTPVKETFMERHRAVTASRLGHIMTAEELTPAVKGLIEKGWISVPKDNYIQLREDLVAEAKQIHQRLTSGYP